MIEQTGMVDKHGFVVKQTPFACGRQRLRVDHQVSGLVSHRPHLPGAHKTAAVGAPACATLIGVTLTGVTLTVVMLTCVRLCQALSRLSAWLER